MGGQNAKILWLYSISINKSNNSFGVVGGSVIRALSLPPPLPMCGPLLPCAAATQTTIFHSGREREGGRKVFFSLSHTHKTKKRHNEG